MSTSGSIDQSQTSNAVLSRLLVLYPWVDDDDGDDDLCDVLTERRAKGWLLYKAM